MLSAVTFLMRLMGNVSVVSLAVFVLGSLDRLVDIEEHRTPVVVELGLRSTVRVCIFPLVVELFGNTVVEEVSSVKLLGCAEYGTAIAVPVHALSNRTKEVDTCGTVENCRTDHTGSSFAEVFGKNVIFEFIG